MHVTATQKPVGQVDTKLVSLEARRIADGFQAIERGLEAYADDTGAMPADHDAIAPAYTFWPHAHEGAMWSFGKAAGPDDTNAWICLTGAVNQVMGRALSRAGSHLSAARYFVADDCAAKQDTAAPTRWPHQRSATYWVKLDALDGSGGGYCVIGFWGSCIGRGWGGDHDGDDGDHGGHDHCGDHHGNDGNHGHCVDHGDD